MKRLVTFALLFVISFPLLSRIVGGEGADVYTYLVCGFDESSENTDSVILLNYDLNSNTATLLQLPRDTVCKYKGDVTRINSIYPKEIASGESPYSAMEKLTAYVGEVMGIDIRGFVGLNLSAFRRFVDNLGGVEVYLEKDITYKDEASGAKLELKAGVNRLDGRAAEHFVRYRKGYLTGDLGRVDMQKIFLSGLVAKLKSGFSFEIIMNFLTDSGDGVVSNCKTRDILGLAVKNRGRIKSADVHFATLPGQSAKDKNKRWVYSANRRACEALLSEQKFRILRSFDENLLLLSESDGELKRIYFDENLNWEKYTEGDVGKINVK